MRRANNFCRADDYGNGTQFEKSGGAPHWYHDANRHGIMTPIATDFSKNNFRLMERDATAVRPIGSEIVIVYRSRQTLIDRARPYFLFENRQCSTEPQRRKGEAL